MPRTIFFIGDDHTTDNWITTGWNTISRTIDPANCILLLEVERDKKNDFNITPEDLLTIAEEKDGEKDLKKLRELLSKYQTGAFDAPGGKTSTKRQDGQAANIAYYANKYKSYNYFVVIVGDFHLRPPEDVEWTPLQDYKYGERIVNILVPRPLGR